MRATPAGVYVIKNGEVEWKPALDVNRVALQRTGAIIAGLFVVRSIIRTLVRNRLLSLAKSRCIIAATEG